MNGVYNRIKILKILLSLCIPLMLIVTIWKVSGIYFETNDDKYITEILSGTFTGSPDSHAVYLNYLLSYSLCLLYRISASVPWYGGMLVLCHFLVYVVLLQSIWSQGRTVLEYVFLGGLVCCCALTNLYMTASIQYTSTAALLAAAGYACLLLNKSYKRGFFFFWGFELMSLFIRSYAMLMIQPLGGSVCIGLYLVSKEEGIKIRCRKIAGVIWAVGFSMVIGYVGNLIGYHGEEWGEYNRFNTARSEMFDYYGALDYEEVKFILDEYNVNQVEYEAFCNYIIMDWDVSAECIEELIKYAENRQNRSIHFGELLKNMWNRRNSSNYLKMNWVSGIAWTIIFFWMLLRRRINLLIPLGGMAIGKTVVWGYLLYKGRLPFRVTAPLYACETFLLVALMVREYVNERKNRGQKVFPILLCAIFAIFCVYVGKIQCCEAIKANGSQKVYMQGLVEIQDYCKENSEKRYLLDAWSFSYYRGSAFETDIYGRQNYAYTGTWYSNSPVSRQYLRSYFKNYDEDFYLIMYDEEGRKDYAGAFIVEKFGKKPEFVDRINTSHGGSYLVWHFGG